MGVELSTDSPFNLQWKQPQPRAIWVDGQQCLCFQIVLNDAQRGDDLLANDFGADIPASDLRHTGLLSSRGRKNRTEILIVGEYHKLFAAA